MVFDVAGQQGHRYPEQAAADQDGSLSGPDGDAGAIAAVVVGRRPERRRIRPVRIQVGGQPPALPAASYQPIIDVGRFPLRSLHLPVGIGDREAGDPRPRSGIGRAGRHLTPRIPDLGAQVPAVAAAVSEKDDPFDRDAVDDPLQFIAYSRASRHHPGQVKHHQIGPVEQHIHAGLPDVAVAQERPRRIAAVPITGPDRSRADVGKHVPALAARSGERPGEFGGELLCRSDHQPAEVPP
jgi:hypothetical protein